MKDAKSAGKWISQLEKASDHNRAHDLFYNRVVFVVYQLGTEEDIETPFGDISDGDVFITTLVKNDFMRYKMASSEITKESLVTFLDDVRNKKLTPFRLSEKPHEEDVYLPESEVLRLTGAQFREKVVQRRDNYFVLFCSEKPVCKFAINVMKYLDRKNPNRALLKLAFINSEKNEVGDG